ncbi:MAG: hypothetical protein PHE51_02720 [Eubacteriales bacterium]|nr:hypothetical protein [Eubacteriales bacterium]
MAKKGMSRPNWTHTKPRNEQAAVPEIKGKAKHGKVKANPIIPGTEAPALKVYHVTPHSDKSEQELVYDNDLAAENLLNDLSEADKQNL